MKRINLNSLSLEELESLTSEIQQEKRLRMNAVKMEPQKAVSANSTAKLTSDCGHIKDWMNELTYYPSFNVGLDKPFALLFGLCNDCAKQATIETILTDERWERMRKILKNNNEKIPKRKDVTMHLEKPIKGNDDMRLYAYAVAA